MNTSTLYEQICENAWFKQFSKMQENIINFRRNFQSILQYIHVWSVLLAMVQMYIATY